MKSSSSCAIAKKILLIDDSEFDRQRIIRALQKTGKTNIPYEIQELDSGECFESEALKWQPDLVILDYNLPGFDGLSLLRRLPEKPDLLPFPVVLITGVGSEAIAADALRMGVLDYLVKDDLNPNAIRNTVERALENSALQKTLDAQNTLLKQNQARLELALKTAGMGIWEWEFASDRLYLSPEAEQIFGDAPGKPWRLMADFYDRIHTNDLSSVVECLRCAIENKTQCQKEFRVILPDERQCWVTIEGRVILDSKQTPERFIGAILDINARKIGEIELKRSRELFERIAAATPDILYLYDRKTQRTVYINETTRYILGRKPEEFRETGLSPLAHLMHPDDLTRLYGSSRSSELSMQSEPVESESRILHQDGSFRWLKIHEVVFTRNGDGYPHIILGLARDITEEKNVTAELLKAKEIAEQANQSKTNFLANISHEIRTPLTAIIGFAELVQDKDQSEFERMTAIKSIWSNAKLLGILVDEILDMAKVEAGRLNTEKIAVHLPTLIEDVSTTMALRAKHKGIELQVEAEPDVPDAILSDPTRLRQCMFNVIGNAIKFTDRGSVHLHISTVSNTAGKLLIKMSVTDTGIGVAPENQSRLFQPFTQADSSTTRRFGGTGLGLFLSKRLSQEMGGDLILEKSAEGIGSTFILTVDAGLYPGKHLRMIPQTQKIATDKKSLAGIRVLVVDDVEDNRLLIGHILGNADATVGFAASGEEAIQEAEHGNFDIILMDIQMSTMDGYEATRILRMRGYRRPIIALTAHASKAERERSLQKGFDEFLSKPIRPNELIDLFESLLRH